MYVKGMLKSHRELGVGRIHEMLRLLVSGDDSGHRYTLSCDELEMFLNGLISSGVLEFVNGAYALSTNDS